MKKMQTKRRRRWALPLAAVLAIVSVVLFGLLLSGCRHDQTTDPVTPSSAGPSGSASADDPVKGNYDVTGRLPSKKEAVAYLSPSSVCVTEKGIYVSDATNFALYKLSETGKVEKTVTFSATVSKVAVSGGKVYALWGELDGALSVFDEALTLEKTVEVGHTPSDVYVDGEKAFIANTFSNSVSVVDLKEGKVVSEIPVSREPYCLAAIDGTLFVGCRLQDGSALQSVLSSKIDKIDLKSAKKTGSVSLQNGATNVRAMAVTGDGKLVITHTVGRYTYPTSQLDRGWVNTNGFTLLDPKTDQTTAFLLDDVEKGAANPWGTAVSTDGKRLLFAAAGTGELISVDYAKLGTRVDKVAAGKDEAISSVDEIVDHIEFLSGIKTRLLLPGQGVRQIAVYDGKVYAAQYFSGDIAVADDKLAAVENSLSLGRQPELSNERLGESIWYDATYCYQSWESCSSCHPGARPDALNWDEGGDGWGTPKNTKSMLFSMRTPPVLATGVMEDAEANVMGTVREAFRSDLSDDKVEAINCFLRSLLPVESPYLTADGTYTESALRGKALFEEAGCAKCHPAPLYTDLLSHKTPYIGSDGTWEDRPMDTPTLVEIWRTAPYTFSGGVTDIKEIIQKFSTKKLTDDEAEDLKNFVLSIGTVDEPYGVEEIFATGGDGTPLYSRLQKGATLDAFTVRRQVSDETRTAAPVIRATLCDASGKVLEEKTFAPGAISYRQFVRCEWGVKLPEDLAAGAYLEITVKDDAGGDLATAYRLYYNA